MDGRGIYSVAMTEVPAVAGQDAAAFAHRIRVRYGDCDMQRVVFNANYLAYLDDTMDVWLQTVLGEDYLARFEYLVKKVTLEWFSAATARDVVEARPAVTRWGRTSFDVAVRMDVAGRLVARADLVLVSIAPGTHDPTPVPHEVRRALGTAG